jgi:hypothetical protein
LVRSAELAALTIITIFRRLRTLSPLLEFSKVEFASRRSNRPRGSLLNKITKPLKIFQIMPAGGYFMLLWSSFFD